MRDWQDAVALVIIVTLVGIVMYLGLAALAEIGGR
jgi:hypothetical protein